MKVFSHLASLSAAATLILQFGTFVEASPFFVGSSTSIHSNAADNTQHCQGLRFSFPSATGLTFEEQSKRVIAWQAPSTLDKVTLTLVNDDDSTNSSIHIGNFDATNGATDELPLDLKGQQPGKYHYHIQATGSAGDCNVDSVPFTIEQQHGNNDGTFDKLLQNIQSQPPSANDHTDAQLDDLKQSQNVYANDETFDNLVRNIQSQPPSANDHTDAQLDDLVDDLKQHHSNDIVLDGLVNDFKASPTSQDANDQDLDGTKQQQPDHQDAALNNELDSLIGHITKASSTTHQDHDNDTKTDPGWDSMINDLNTLPSDTKDSSNQTPGLDQLMDDLTQSFKDNTHSDSAVDHTDSSDDPAVSYSDEWFTNSDLRAKIKKAKRSFIQSLIKRGGGEINNGERTSSTHANAPVTTSHPVWSTNGGFFSNDDQRTNVNAGGIHNDAEWSEDVAVVEEDGVWHMDEIVDTPEWTVSDAPTVLDHHQDSIWESEELAADEAPNHHHNDIEWNVPTIEKQAPNHHQNDIEWNVNSNDEDSVVDHTNFVHWDAETDAIEDENDDDDHMNAAPEGEWVDDDHINAGDDNLEWAQDSVDAMEDDDNTGSLHDNDVGEWQTDEHFNYDDLTDNSNRWNLNEGVTEWSTNAFDENDGNNLLPNVPNYANNDASDEWISSEHANDNNLLQNDESLMWNVNDGPSEWSMDSDDISGVDQAHDNDATLISQWLSDEHANDDDEWTVNEASTGWTVNEASTTTTGQHANANEWNVNEASGDWNTDPSGQTTQSKSATSSSHSNASPQWLAAEDVHSNDVNW